MLLVREGQLSELTELFERYHVPLYNFFFRLTMDGALSEDLTHDVFYRVLRYRLSFEPASGSFRSWIYRMARNVHADHFRQEQRVPGGMKGTLPFPDGGTGSGEDVPYSEDQFERLDAAMARLKPDEREILVLSRYQGLKYDEISKIKDLSVPAIKVQVYRALRQLRAFYFKQ